MPLTVIYNLVRGLPSGRARGMNLKFVAISLFFRVSLGSLRPRYLQSVSPGTIAQYKLWVAAKRKELAAQNPVMAKRLREDIEPIPGADGASILWMGDRERASKFVVFFHGGGYIAGATRGHFEWCWRCYVAGGPGEKGDVAVAVVQYTLCPQEIYPGQLRQVCAGLSMVLDRGISPSNIIFGGDSAGGNLTSQVIRHIVEPHPGIQPITLEEPIAGAFMVSPLVDGRVDSRSYQENATVDMISAALCLNTSVEMLQPKNLGMTMKEMRGLAFPMEGDYTWMMRINSVVKSLYITAGKQEVFADHIVQFAELVRRQCPELQIRFEMAQREAHDFIILEGILGEGFDATKRMQVWASEVL